MSNTTNSSIELVTRFQGGKRFSSASITDSDQIEVEPVSPIRFTTRKSEEKPLARRKEPNKIDLSYNVIDGNIFEEAHKSLEKKKKLKKKKKLRGLTPLERTIQSTPFSIVNYIDLYRNKKPENIKDSKTKEKKKVKYKKKKKNKQNVQMTNTDSYTPSSLEKPQSSGSHAQHRRKDEPEGNNIVRSINIDLMKNMGSKIKLSQINGNNLREIKEELNTTISARRRKTLHTEEYSILGKILELKYNI